MMSKALGMRVVGLYGVLASVLVLGSVARADVSTDVSGSVLVFPKVLWTGSAGRDTVIGITNTSNMPVIAHCFYVNAREVQRSPLWQVTDFTLTLTKKQPTHWVASRGRRVQPLDSCDESGRSKVFTDDCDAAGLDPGSVPPVSTGFVGELKCVEVDEAGHPSPSNSLKGEALLRDASGDVSKYSAIAIAANLDCPDAESCTDNVLRLDNTDTHDGEYNSCPNQILVDHFADGLESPVVSEFNEVGCTNGSCEIHTTLTLVPCSQDFENLIPSEVTLGYLSSNEFEELNSGTFKADCWYNKRMSDLGGSTSGNCSVGGSSCSTDEQCAPAGGICAKPANPFAPGTRGSSTFYTVLTPADDATKQIFEGGVIGVAEEIHYIADGTAGAVNSAAAAWNLQKLGTRFDALSNAYGEQTAVDNADTITVPERF